MKQNSQKEIRNKGELKEFWEEATKADNMLHWVAIHSAEALRNENKNEQKIIEEDSK